MENYIFVIDEQTKNIRIDSYLSQMIEDCSRSFIQKLIDENHILVNKNIVKSNYKLKCNDIVDVNIPEPKAIEIEPENIPLNILYEDKDIIVINKEQGMVVHPSYGHYSGTVVNALLYHCKGELSGINGVMRPGIVHRIDKDTSGVIVAAKNNNAHQKLANQLKEHSITRKYNAIVYNNLKNDTGTIDAPIGRHPIYRKKMTVTDKNSKRAVTHYRVIERFGKYTFIEAQLETGRTHQIRVHMSYIGYPLVGDEVYGSKNQPFKLNGQLLHARVLGFIHPSTNKYIEFEADIPEYFQKVLNELRKQRQ